jgi:two-component sensor histidine kinase
MEDYLRDLIQHLRESFGQSSSIRFSLHLDPINLDVSQAVPIGLIVNEAITNPIKYAFADKSVDNQIDVSLKRHEEKIELVIADNGVGMPDAKKENTQSLGLKLMRGLTEDIEGVYTINSEKGVCIRIQFVPNVPFHKMDMVAASSYQIQPA